MCNTFVIQFTLDMQREEKLFKHTRKMNLLQGVDDGIMHLTAQTEPVLTKVTSLHSGGGVMLFDFPSSYYNSRALIGFLTP